jgi:hypothetical protein
MKADERTISKVLTEQICYEIPPYQRPYSWKNENVQQLWEDVWQAYEANDSEYFIGSIITIEKDRDRRYEVVDGQQRLTTLNLILARLRDHITDEAVKAELGKRILPRDVFTGWAISPCFAGTRTTGPNTTTSNERRRFTVTEPRRCPSTSRRRFVMNQSGPPRPSRRVTSVC